MDRNLGALDDRYHSASANKSKYYEFGRKDPFNSDIYCWSYDAGTFAPTKSASANGGRIIIYRTTIDGSGTGGFNTGGKNMPFSVNNPNVYIYHSNSWTGAKHNSDAAQAECTDDPFNPFPFTSIEWSDPHRDIRIENEEISMSSGGNKSFFDPCPQGWRLPVNGWANGFVGDASGDATGSTRVNCQWVPNPLNNTSDGTIHGRTYYPLGYLAEKDNPNAQKIFFPAFGYFRYNWSYGSSGDYYSSTPENTTNGYRLTITQVEVNPSHLRSYYSRTCSYCARCVKE